MKAVRGLVAMLLLIAVGAIILVLIATGFVEGMLWLSGILGLQHALGMDTQTSKNYASVSGVLPMMIASLGFSGFAAAMWKHVNCEKPGCPWPGHRHPEHGRPVCRRHYHHPVAPSAHET